MCLFSILVGRLVCNRAINTALPQLFGVRAGVYMYVNMKFLLFFSSTKNMFDAVFVLSFT